jgi:hypothetical protein
MDELGRWLITNVRDMDFRVDPNTVARVGCHGKERCDTINNEIGL